MLAKHWPSVGKFADVLPTLPTDGQHWPDLACLLGKTITNIELQQFIVMDVTLTIIFPEFFCYSLAVGRLVKVVSEASKAVCGPKSRDRLICARTASRQLMPRFESKRYVTHFNL